MSSKKPYGVLLSQIWVNPPPNGVSGLSPIAQVVMVYLHTATHRARHGVFRCPSSYISTDTGHAQALVTEALQVLELAGLISVFEDWIWVMGWLDTPFALPNTAPNLVKLAEDITSIPRYLPFLHEFARRAIETTGLIEHLEQYGTDAKRQDNGKVNACIAFLQSYYTRLPKQSDQRSIGDQSASDRRSISERSMINQRLVADVKIEKQTKSSDFDVQITDASVIDQRSTKNTELQNKEILNTEHGTQNTSATSAEETLVVVEDKQNVLQLNSPPGTVEATTDICIKTPRKVLRLSRVALDSIIAGYGATVDEVKQATTRLQARIDLREVKAPSELDLANRIIDIIQEVRDAAPSTAGSGVGFNASATSPDFAKFCSDYPSHRISASDHPSLWEEWSVLVAGDPEVGQQILAQLSRFKKSDAWRSENGRWVPGPKKWLVTKAFLNEVKVSLVHDVLLTSGHAAGETTNPTGALI